MVDPEISIYMHETLNIAAWNVRSIGRGNLLHRISQKRVTKCGKEEQKVLSAFLISMVLNEPIFTEITFSPNIF
jgi:hypothetical protein